MNVDYKIVRLRCLAILFVVFGHSIILYDPQWGLYSSIYSVAPLMELKHIINTFQMPLFLMLAGFCFFYSISKRDYKDIKNILGGVISKVKRLLVPFVVIALFWMIPIRLICSYAAWDGLNIFQIIGYVFVGKDSGHLWFLPTLFLIFLFAYVIFPRIDKIYLDILLLAFAFGCSLISAKIPAVLFINNVASSLYWFCLGYEICKYKKKIDCVANAKVKYLAFALSVVILFVVQGRANKLVEEVAVTFLLLSGYICISAKECSWICRQVSDKSMGIYLLHSPLIYFTYAFYSNGFPLLVVLINFVLDGVLAFVLTMVIVKGKFKFLLGY